VGGPERWFAVVSLGLACGSFAAVLVHRLPRQGSVLSPRSHCPSCRHPLGVLDLVPLLSYLWLRGRCRYCARQIPARYPLMESGTAALAGFGYLAGGLFAMTVVLFLWCGLLALVSRPAADAERGATLLEMLAATAILALVLAPMAEAILALRAGPKASYYRAVATNIARAKAEELHAQYLRGTLPGVPSGPWTEYDPYGLTGYSVEWWFRAAPDIVGGSGAHGRQLAIRVSCPDCGRLYGIPFQEYWLITVIRKVN
jgi:hypothetical protein